MLEASSREVPRTYGSGRTFPPSLCRHDRERRQQEDRHSPSKDRQRDSSLLRWPRVHRSRNPGSFAHRGRGGRASFHYPPQCAGQGFLPSHRHGIEFEEGHDRRHWPRLRDWPHLPQRGHWYASQPRIHDHWALSSLWRPSVDEGMDRRAPQGHRRKGVRKGWNSLGRRDDWFLQAVPLDLDGRSH